MTHVRGFVGRMGAACALAFGIAGQSAPALAATVVCSAAEIIANESNCPSSPTAACEIAGDYDITQSACTLDFGSRSVTIKGTSLIDAGSKSLTLITGPLLIKKYAEIRAKGDGASSAGGTVTVQSAGDITIENTSDINVSSGSVAGTATVTATGSLLLDGRIRADGTVSAAKGGTVTVTAATDIIAGGTATLSAKCGNSMYSPGKLLLTAGGRIDLDGTVSLIGADGGRLIATGQTGVKVITEVDADATAVGGTGGDIEINSFGDDGDIEILGRLLARGKAGPGQENGEGGYIELWSERDIFLRDNLLAEGDGYDAGGGSLKLMARRSISMDPGVSVSTRTDAGEGDGGEIEMTAYLDIWSSAYIDSSGGASGGRILIEAERDIAINRWVDAKGRGPGADGGDITIAAAAHNLDGGNLTIDDYIDTAGGICGTSGCGLGGNLEIYGCNVVLGPDSNLYNRGAEGGATWVDAEGLLTVDGGAVINASHNIGSAGVDGAVFLRYSQLVASGISPSAMMTPAPSVEAFFDYVCGS